MVEYDGRENLFIEELRSSGVNIVRHRTTLYDQIVKEKPNDPHFIRVASGAFLRVDIPIVEQSDEFVLYTDCDVMFLKDPEVSHLRPRFLSVAPEFTRGDYDNLNTGVMLINIPNMRVAHGLFVHYIGNLKISTLEAYDQQAFRDLFKGSYDKLPETLNWKPYWGKNRDAEILHFHGPKPPHIRALLNNPGEALPDVLNDLYHKDPTYYREVVDVWFDTLTKAPTSSEERHEKFEHRAPSAQTAVDIFAGKWASNLESVCGVTGTGMPNLFEDARVQMAADTLGRNGRLDGASILELGPLEGAHTYQLERLGAERVVAVESNTEAFLKCLIVKELLHLKSEFRCGDVVAHLTEAADTYDMIFCSGILYHMADPVELIRLICLRTSACFVWTHYQSDDATKQNRRTARPVTRSGFETTYYDLPYPDMSSGGFWGGNRPVAAYMTQTEIIRAFQHFGLSLSKVWQDPNNPNGSAFSLAAWR